MKEKKPTIKGYQAEIERLVKIICYYRHEPEEELIIKNSLRSVIEAKGRLEAEIAEKAEERKKQRELLKNLRIGAN